LRERGFRIAVASSRAEASFHEADLDIPTAIYLGTEYQGNSEHIYKHSDLVFRLPQHGFTESLNVSVCAGMMVSLLDRHMDVGGRSNYTLTAPEQEALVAKWSLQHDAS
jgi:tRNA (guanosine-2'-O-)-methyltransferase